MSKHLEMDLGKLKKELLLLGSMVTEAINKATLAVVDRRPELAEEVIKGDDLINDKEVSIEGDCLKILALHQPVAADLRFIIVVLKVNNDLERMGDLAVNIAERAVYLSRKERIAAALDFPHMVEGVKKMVHGSINALINQDTGLAREVLAMDDEIDEYNRDMYITLQNVMQNNPETIKRAVHLLSTSRHLERIADLSTNIAEEVVFMVDGESIRHRTEDYREN